MQLELVASPAAHPRDPAGVTVAELLCAYLDFAERHYCGPDGRPTSEVYEVKVVIRAVRELYADTPVGAFGPLTLKAAWQKWVGDGRSRTECDQRVGMVKHIFKWAASEELAPGAASRPPLWSVPAAIRVGVREAVGTRRIRPLSRITANISGASAGKFQAVSSYRAAARRYRPTFRRSYLRSYAVAACGRVWLGSVRHARTAPRMPPHSA